MVTFSIVEKKNFRIKKITFDSNECLQNILNFKQILKKKPGTVKLELQLRFERFTGFEVVVRRSVLNL